MKLILLFPFICFTQNYLNFSDSNTRTLSTIKSLKHFSRTKSDTNSFSTWLRNFPIKEEFSEVFYFDDEPKYDQSIHYEILDIDIGSKIFNNVQMQLLDYVLNIYTQ